MDLLEASRILVSSPSLVALRLERGDLPHRRVGTCVLIRRDDVLSLKARLVDSEAATNALVADGQVMAAPYRPLPPASRRTTRPPVGPGASRRVLECADALAALLDHRPAVLPTVLGETVRPLAIGAGEALAILLRPEATREQLDEALRSYVRRLAYQVALATTGSSRHDLEGAVVEAVAPLHRRWAAFQVRRDLAKAAARQDAEAAARATRNLDACDGGRDLALTTRATPACP